jgi:hypothetical protein
VADDDRRALDGVNLWRRSPVCRFKHDNLDAPTIDRLSDWLDVLRRSVRANPPAAMGLLASGLYLGSEGWWSQPWFYVALGAWVANFSCATFVVKPSVAALSRAATGAGSGPAVDRLRHSLAS